MAPNKRFKNHKPHNHRGESSRIRHHLPHDDESLPSEQAAEEEPTGPKSSLPCGILANATQKGAQDASFQDLAF
ncbi:hypothetical protein M0R45_005203 [Rubus argutus]|uniref:Uncharacterized protein n=1 Tax=Rubus argutus TaxID=59490 RepID=A0AAW1YLZ9_RUBAR